MKRLVTSDWQLCDNPRDRYRTDWVVNELPKLIDKYKPDQLLVLGDVTEQKDNHPAALVNEIVNLFYNLQKKCTVIILEGNHDFLHKEHPYFEFVSRFEEVAWISVPLSLDGCLYLPHTRDYKKDWKGIDFNGHDFIFAHNIFEGVKANGQKLSGIPLSIFPEDTFCISGDVHEPQTLGPVNYVGSPFTTDFGDDFQPRVLLLDKLHVRSIKVYGPQKRLIELIWDKEKEFNFVYSVGDILKIRVHLEMKHVAEWDRIRSQVMQMFPKTKIHMIVPVVAYDISSSKIVRAQQKSDKEYLSEFVSRAAVDSKTYEVGKSFIHEC